LISHRSNSISGPLPNFKKMPQLVNVWFDGNQLEGTLNDVGALQHLTFLKVNNNLLSGTMPSSLCNIKCDASGNKNITCPLPTTGCYGLLSNDIVWWCTWCTCVTTKNKYGRVSSSMMCDMCVHLTRKGLHIFKISLCFTGILV
jgi:hypothetical protein